MLVGCAKPLAHRDPYFAVGAGTVTRAEAQTLQVVRSMTTRHEVELACARGTTGRRKGPMEATTPRTKELEQICDELAKTKVGISGPVALAYERWRSGERKEYTGPGSTRTN